MRLYYWSAECLRDWQDGDVVVMASNVAEAREMAIAEGTRQWGPEAGDDPDKLAQLKRDVSAPAKIFSGKKAVMFFMGSA